MVETVSVKDKNGNPVENLTAKDFTITEDGVAQTIRFFEFQKMQDNLPALSASPSGRPVPFPKLPKSQIAPEAPGNTKYRDHRLLALYFDMSAMPETDQLRAFAAAQKFIQTQMTASDLMAIMVYEEGAVQILQDFTADRDRLQSIVETLIVGEDQNTADTANDASSADTGAAFGQDDSEFNIFNTDRQLSALQTAAQMLGSLNEKKALIYFASGLRLNGVDNQAQLHATINAAIRAGVSFWPIDARGLMAEAPLGDATHGSPGGIAMYNGASAMAFRDNFQKSQDTLWTLAADTGGKALLDYNDLTKGMVQAQQAISSYYIIGYYTSNAALDGKFRRIKISLANGLSASIDYRQGYFAGKQFGKFTTADKERQLEDALMLGDPVTELTIAMEIDYFQLNRAEYFVPVVVKIPGSELALAKRGGAEHTLLDFIGEIKDDFGTTISNVRDKVDIKLSDATAAELAKRPVQYDTGFTLLPGKYKIKFLARDAETGRIGTFETAFRDSQPEQGGQADRDQLGGVEQPARGLQRCALQRGQGQGKDRERQSAGAGRPEADSERDAGVQQGPRDVRVSAGLSAGGRQRTPAGSVCDVLSRPGQGVRDSAARSDRCVEQSAEDHAAEVQPVAQQAAAGRIQLPGDDTRSDRPKGGVLAGAGDVDPVVGKNTGLPYGSGSATGFWNPAGVGLGATELPPRLGADRPGC